MTEKDYYNKINKKKKEAGIDLNKINTKINLS